MHVCIRYSSIHTQRWIKKRNETETPTPTKVLLQLFKNKMFRRKIHILICRILTSPPKNNVQAFWTWKWVNYIFYKINFFFETHRRSFSLIMSKLLSLSLSVPLLGACCTRLCMIGQVAIILECRKTWKNLMFHLAPLLQELTSCSSEQASCTSTSTVSRIVVVLVLNQLVNLLFLSSSSRSNAIC